MKYQLNPKQQRQPIGGHHFYEGNIKMKGDTFNDVVELVENFRLVNGIPIGNPRQEVIDYYADKFPFMVQFDLEDAPAVPPNPDYDAWRTWLASLWGKPARKSVTKKESSMRCAVCLDCPHNAKFSWDESRESDEFQRKALMLRFGHPAPEKIGYCNLHCVDISVASFIESLNGLSQKQQHQPDYPKCWFPISGESQEHQ